MERRGYEIHQRVVDQGIEDASAGNVRRRRHRRRRHVEFHDAGSSYRRNIEGNGARTTGGSRRERHTFERRRRRRRRSGGSRKESDAGVAFSRGICDHGSFVRFGYAARLIDGINAESSAPRRRLFDDAIDVGSKIRLNVIDHRFFQLVVLIHFFVRFFVVGVLVEVASLD